MFIYMFGVSDEYLTRKNSY